MILDTRLLGHYFFIIYGELAELTFAPFVEVDVSFSELIQPEVVTFYVAWVGHSSCCC